MTRDLVERARKGDHDAFAELAGAAISRLDATAWLMLRDPDRATDAVQNALVRAWRDLPTRREPNDGVVTVLPWDEVDLPSMQRLVP